MDTDDFDAVQQVINLFHESIEAKMHVIDDLAPLVADAADIISQCFLDDNKIMIVGNGTSGTIAQQFTANLISRHQKERPSLPAICLNTDIITLGAIANDSNYNEVYAKQIRALGHTGDLLFAVTTDSSSATLVHAIKAAHDREMSVIVLTGSDEGDTASILTQEDLEICVQSESFPRLHEIHLLTIFCLCDLIDKQIFGSLS